MHGARYTADMRQTLRIDSTLLMQKIMMPAKLWCDHAEGFESDLRVWELDVGEWERASGTALADAIKCTVMMNMAPIFLRNSLQLGIYANSAALRTALLQWCFFFLETLERVPLCQLEMEQVRMMTTGCKLTLSSNGKHQNQKGTRTNNTRNKSSTSNTCKNCGRTGH